MSRDSAGCEARNRRPRLWRITLRVQRDGRHFTVDVVPDGDGLVSHAGAALLAEAADRLGLTAALSRALAPMRERRSRHDPGRVVRDLVVMLADGGDCLADLRAVRDQQPLFGAVASDATAFRVIDAIAADPDPEPLARERNRPSSGRAAGIHQCRAGSSMCSADNGSAATVRRFDSGQCACSNVSH